MSDLTSENNQISAVTTILRAQLESSQGILLQIKELSREMAIQSHDTMGAVAGLSGEVDALNESIKILHAMLNDEKEIFFSIVSKIKDISRKIDGLETSFKTLKEDETFKRRDTIFNGMQELLYGECMLIDLLKKYRAFLKAVDIVITVSKYLAIAGVIGGLVYGAFKVVVIINGKGATP